MEAPVSPTTLGQSLQFFSFPLWRFKEARAAGKGRAWRAPPGVGPGCGAGRASSPPRRGCSRACTRAAVLQRAGRAAPVAPHPRAWVSAPSASRCSSAGAGGISAKPHPLRTLSLLGVSAAASETRRRLCEPCCGARLRRSPGGLTSALCPGLTWFCAWRGSVTRGRLPTASRKVHGRAFPRLRHAP